MVVSNKEMYLQFPNVVPIQYENSKIADARLQYTVVHETRFMLPLLKLLVL